MSPPSKRAEEVISLAHQWTFANDSLLLEWMKDIGKNLEDHANSTIGKLALLAADVRNANTALENATNSLSILQHTQFIENRCLDDDETVPNVAEVDRLGGTNENDVSKMSNETFDNIFLKRNLDAFRNCHEREAINYHDSDGKDETQNYIYKPKNPYNERPLPYIYGSKLWKKHWHVGVLEDSNTNRGDTISQGISETSSPHEDIDDKLHKDCSESVIINKSTHISSKLFANEQKQKQNIQQENQITDVSSTSWFNAQREHSKETRASSATSSVTSTGAPVETKENETHNVFPPIPDTPPLLSSSSSAASLVQKPSLPPPPPVPQSEPLMQHPKVEQRQYKPVVKTVSPPIDSNTSHIRRRPVNLFEDDDFNSFLTETVDTTNAPTTNKALPIAAARSTAALGDAFKSEKAFQKQPPHPRKVDLFDDNNSPSIVDRRVQNIHESSSIFNDPSVNPDKHRTRLNLFENSDFSPTEDDDFLSKIETNPNKSQKLDFVSNKISTRNLFDDDDDDDDFLNIFKTKKKEPPKFTVKTSLFDDDDDDDLMEPADIGSKSTTNDRVIPTDKTQNVVTETFKGLQSNEVSSGKALQVLSKRNTNQQKGLKEEEANITAVTPKKHNDAASDDLFCISNQPIPSLRSNKVSLTGFSDDDELDLLGSKKETTEKNKENTPVSNNGTKSQATIDNLTRNISNEQNREESIEVTENISINECRQQQTKQESEVIDDNDQDSFQIETKADSSLDIIYSDFKDKLIVRPDKELDRRAADSSLNNKSGNVPSVAKTNPVSKYSGLFLEAEPPEDNAFDKNALEKSALHNIGPDFYYDVPVDDRRETAASKLFSSNTYGSLGLYSEIPPPDDGEGDVHFDEDATSNINQRSEPKRSIFYDDFDETMAAVNKRKTLEATKSLHAIFDDEPPMDDDFQTILKDAGESKNIPIANPKNIDLGKENNVLANVENELNASETGGKPIRSLEKIEVSKLDATKMNINVEALLPPTALFPTVPKAFDPPAEDATTYNVSEPISSPFRNEHSTTNILVNVCKNRVRIATKRRPSTRRARQENYRKSLLAEEAEERKSVTEQDTNHSREVMTDKQSSEFDRIPKLESENVNSLKEEAVEGSPANDSCAQKSSVNETKEDVFAEAGISKDFSIRKSETISFLSTTKEPPSRGVATKPSITNLFANSDDDDDDDLFSEKKKTNELENTTRVSKHFGEDAPKSVVPKPTFSFKGDNTETVKGGNINLDIKIKASSRISETMKKPSLPKDVERKIGQSTSLFGDVFDDDDDDDLFSGGSLKTRPQAGTAAEAFKSTKSLTSKMPELVVGWSSAAFDSKTIKTKEFAISKTKSLFGSGDEDDEDGNSVKFLNVMKPSSSEQNVKPLKIETKMQISSLFDDTDDDDDDLFSSKGSKAGRDTLKTVTIQQANKFKSTTRTRTKSITNTDNPLADLLNN